MPIIDEEFLSHLEYQPLFEAEAKEDAEAFNKICALVNIRDRSAHEIRARLHKAGFNEKTSEQAITRALACGLLDDVRFAKTLVRSRVCQGKGNRAIIDELEKNGINTNLLSGWPEEFIPEEFGSEYDRACAFLKRHAIRSKHPRRACINALVSRGYPYEMAYQLSKAYPVNANQTDVSDCIEDLEIEGFGNY